MVNDLILQVDSGDVLWVGHSDSEQDAHQQVHYLSGGKRRLKWALKYIDMYSFTKSR